MKTNSKKFDQIVDAAKSLFWKHGIKRVTVEEICDNAQVSKMTFYKHFSNKTELAKYILKNLFDEGIQIYRDIESSDIPYVDKVKKIIQMKMDMTNEISQEFLNDVYKGDDPELAKMVENYLQRNMKMIQDDLKKAQREGNIRKDMHPEFLIYILNRVIDMTTDENLNKLFNNPQEMIHEFVNFFYYGVMPYPQKNTK